MITCLSVEFGVWERQSIEGIIIYSYFKNPSFDIKANPCSSPYPVHVSQPHERHARCTKMRAGEMTICAQYQLEPSRIPYE